MCRKFSFLVSFVLVLSLVGNASAVTYGDKDIGPVAIAGSSSEAAGVWTVSGSGADIWAEADEFHYVYRPVSGDFEVEVTLNSMTAVHSWANVGVMIRETSNPASKHAIMCMTGDPVANGWQFQYRNSTGGGSGQGDKGTPYLFPEKLMIKRIVGGGAAGEDKIEGWYWNVVVPFIYEYWDKLADVNMPLADDILVGLAVTSHDNSQLETAEFSAVGWPAAPYEKAWDMIPLDGAASVPVDVSLSWLPGDSATSHDVYLGTSNPPPFADTVAGLSYTPPALLEEGLVYYYQVVEQPLGVAGPVRSFTTYLTPPPPVGIQRCVWEGIGGTIISDLINNPAYPDSPSWCDQLSSMATYDFADNYGQRMQGLLWPETSGDYTFWIAGDDSQELWLSTDEDPANLVKIAEHVGWTNAHNWFDAPEQQSAAIPLVGGQMYLIQAFLKEGGGGDNSQVAWSGPDQPIWPVQGNATGIITDYFFPPYDLQAGLLAPAEGVALTPIEAETLSWTGKRGATAYEVYYGEGSMALIYSGLDTSIAAPTPELGKAYNWKVNVVYDTGTVEGNVWSFGPVQEWVSRDIGREALPNPPGSSSYDPVTGEYTMKAAGNYELWGNNDQFHFLYKTMRMTRDQGSIKARVLDIQLRDSWRRAGVMIRSSTADNAAKAMAHKTGHDRTRMQFRDFTGAGTGGHAENPGLGFPMWVRMDRNGNQYDGYYSQDGENWSHLGNRTITMDNDYVCVGLAMCHHPSLPPDQFSIGTFEGLEITTADPRAAWNPSPSDGAENIPLDVTVSWNAGVGVVEHLLYVSESYEDVMYGLVDPIVLPGGTTEYNVGKLNLATVNYWAVDSITREGRDLVTTLGDIWSFKVENFRLVDDFEGYCIAPDPLPPQETIPGDVDVEAVPPAEQAWVEPQVLVEAVAPGTDCLIAEWTFEGNYDDTSGSGFHGTPVGDVNIVNDAERGDVLTLAGGQDYVDCGNPAALNFSTGDWTLSAWVKNTMTGTGDDNKGCIVGNGGDGGGGHRYCMIQSEQSEAEVTLVTDDNSSKKQARGDNTKVNDDVWHSVIGIREGNSIRIYIDGKLEGSSGTNDNYDLSGASQANVLIGAMTLASDSSIYKTYAGLIDDVQIYDCALTEGNVRYLSGIGDLVKDGYFGPCIVHYPLDENGGLVANDVSGNDLHGAITDAAWTAVTADGSASCLDFNGFGGNILNSAAGPILNNQGALSISLWVQSDLTDTDKGFIMLADSGSDRHGMRYDKAGGSGGGTPNVIKYGVATTGGNEEDESSEGLQTTEWQHIVMTWKSGTGLQLWINGVLDGPTFDAGAVTGLLTGYTKIQVAKGSKDGSATSSWDGRIDDVRIYDSVLTEGEIRYLAGVGHTYLPDWYSPLIGHWEAEGTADDSSGNGFHGTPVGDATIVMDPVMGLVGSFDGDGDAINVGNSSLFNFEYSDFSIAAWINMSSYGGNWGNCIVGKRGEGGVGWQIRRLSDTHRISFTTRNCGDQDGWGDGGTNVSLNEWHHVAAVRQGTQKWLYVDGVKEAVSGICDYVQPCPHDVYIGARSNGGNTGPEANFNGMIDDVRIYLAALSVEQVAGIIGCEDPIENTWTTQGEGSLGLEYNLPGHESSRSIRLEYSGKIKRAVPFQDWGSGNAKALTMHFRGDPGNAPGNMFAFVFGCGKAFYTGDPEDLLNPDWQEWNIAFEDFDGCENLTTAYHMGVHVLSDGAGVVWFDDMRLYPPRCVPSLSSASDLNQDCIVDGRDLRILVGDYLMGDYTISAETPDAAGLMASYQFEGDYDDSSGNGNHGTPVGAGITIETDATMGQVLSLPGGDDIFVDCNGVGISGAMPRTIACWAKADHTSIPDWTLVFGFTTTGGGNNTHFNIGSLGGPGGVGAHVWGWEATIFNDTEALDWRHYAMAYDGDLVDFYGDGNLIGTVSRGALVNADNVYIGSRITQTSSFPGDIDDARIYNYALSYGEIRTLAGQGDLYVPLESIANLHDEEPANSRLINFKDYGVLTLDWLDEIVWP